MKEHLSGPFPTFFRAALYESRSTTCANAALTLAPHIRSYLEEVDREHELDAARTGEDVWHLIASALPRIAAGVPRRRRGTFVRGLQLAIERERL